MDPMGYKLYVKGYVKEKTHTQKNDDLIRFQDSSNFFRYLKCLGGQVGP